MTELPISERLMEMIFFALDHGVGSVQAGGPLVPFVVTHDESAELPVLQRFLSETLETSLVEARRHCATVAADIKYCVLAYDGFVTVDGSKNDAIMVEAFERGTEEAVCFAQRYKPKGFLRKFSVVGNAAFLGMSPALF